MAADLAGVIEAWEGEQVVARFDEPTGTWMFVCIHSRRLGPAAGGTRMKVYGSPAEALRDCTRLAAGMTAKFAVAGLPFGGGKGVLAVPRLPEGEERRALLHRYGRLVCSLGGNYLTGCDMNTAPADLDTIAEVCPHVFGNSAGSGEPGPFTARGVFHNVGREALGWGDAEVERALEGIGGTLTEIFERSDAEGISTGRAADDLVAARLA